MQTQPSPRIIGASVAELTQAYREGRLDPREVVEVMLAAARVAGERYRAISTLNAEDARAAARASAHRYREGRALGPLDGVPVSVKDSINVAGLKRWHGSRAYDDRPPASIDGAPVRRLREAGAVVFAKTAMPDFGQMAAGLSSQFGTILNPWNTALSPGGSSSGAAVLLACGIGPLAVGTDMGGSVRLPGSHCGVVGLKPTQGRVAYDPPKLIGVAGPMARSVVDAQALLTVIGAYDPADSLSLPGRFEAAPPLASPRGLRIGVWREVGYGPPVQAEVAAVLEGQAARLRAAGARVSDIAQAPFTAQDMRDMALYYDTKAAFELESLAPPRREEVLGFFREMLEGARHHDAMSYLRAEAAALAAAARLRQLVDAYDFVLSPVMPVVGFAADAVGPPGCGRFDHLGFTAWFNLSTQPAICVPVACSASGQMPIGVQLAGPRFADAGVQALAAWLERQREHVLAYPFVDPGEPAHEPE